MDIVYVSLQIALLIERLVANRTGKVVTFGVDGVDVTVEVGSPGNSDKHLSTEHAPRVGTRV